jgi:signal transduction histidine kinase
MLSGWLMHDFRNKLAVISGNIQIIQIKKTDISPDVLASRLAIAMKMIEETLKLFDDIGSFSQRAAGIAMEISTEKAINRTVAILKRQFEQFGIRVKKNGADPDYTFRCDAGLFDYILISLIEMLLPYNRTEGELILSSSLQENEWKMDAHLTIVGNNSTVSEDFRNRIVSMEMNVIQMGIKELNGKLEVSHTDESMGFELRLPV